LLSTEGVELRKQPPKIRNTSNIYVSDASNMTSGDGSIRISSVLESDLARFPYDTLKEETNNFSPSAFLGASTVPKTAKF
jgi:hypothetical protein